MCVCWFFFRKDTTIYGIASPEGWKIYFMAFSIIMAAAIRMIKSNIVSR